MFRALDYCPVSICRNAKANNINDQLESEHLLLFVFYALAVAAKCSSAMLSQSAIAYHF